MSDNLPAPVYKPSFSITRASQVVHRVKDLAASKAFYVDLLGHHSLVLKAGGTCCVRP